MAPNILFSFALIRIARPSVQILMQHHGWAAFAILVSALFAVLPIAANIVDYGAEGWLWALADFIKVFIALVLPLLALAAVIEVHVTPSVVVWAFGG